MAPSGLPRAITRSARSRPDGIAADNPGPPATCAWRAASIQRGTLCERSRAVSHAWARTWERSACWEGWREVQFIMPAEDERHTQAANGEAGDDCQQATEKRRGSARDEQGSAEENRAESDEA